VIGNHYCYGGRVLFQPVRPKQVPAKLLIIKQSGLDLNSVRSVASSERTLLRIGRLK
jgi:hypothetical protein